jgi:hypothetical protein
MLAYVQGVGGPQHCGYDNEVLLRQRCEPSWTMLHVQKVDKGGGVRQYTEEFMPVFVQFRWRWRSRVSFPSLEVAPMRFDITLALTWGW